MSASLFLVNFDELSSMKFSNNLLNKPVLVFTVSCSNMFHGLRMCWWKKYFFVVLNLFTGNLIHVSCERADYSLYTISFAISFPLVSSGPHSVLEDHCSTPQRGKIYCSCRQSNCYFSLSSHLSNKIFITYLRRVSWLLSWMLKFWLTKLLLQEDCVCSTEQQHSVRAAFWPGFEFHS